MKNSVKQKILRVVAKIAEVESNILYAGWPPPCLGIIYQPKRPKKVNGKNENEKSN